MTTEYEDHSSDTSSEDESTKQSVWVMQEEIDLLLNSLLDCIPQMIAPLAHIMKEYIGLNGLFLGLGLFCYDLTGKLCAATIINLKEDAVLIHYDGWTSKWDQWISKQHYDYRLVDWNSALPPQHNMSSTLSTNEQKRQDQLCSCGHFYRHHSGVDWADWCTYCECSNL